VTRQSRPWSRTVRCETRGDAAFEPNKAVDIDSFYVIAGLEAAATIDTSSALLQWEAQARRVIGGERMLSQQHDISRQLLARMRMLIGRRLGTSDLILFYITRFSRGQCLSHFDPLK